jgi:hypothetical protein
LIERRLPVPRTTPPASIFSGPGEACPEHKSERPALPRLLVVFRELRLEPEAVQLGGAMPKPGPAHQDRPIPAEYARRREHIRIILHFAEPFPNFIVRTGIATDSSTSVFFRNLAANRKLFSLHDFQTGRGYFDHIGHARFKF